MIPIHITRRAFTSPSVSSFELLTRFKNDGDEEAFADLVHQFGPLVLATCRRVVAHPADADDAFQAVFLTFARGAASIRDAAALPAWLHRVAVRVSRKALAQRRPTARLPDVIANPTDPFADVAWKDVKRILDEELNHLPERYRGPAVLCWLDGATQDEAAKRLGVSLNTLKRRLSAGRELMRRRLLRRGVGPLLVAAAVLEPAGLRAAVPAELLAATVRMPNLKFAPAQVAALVAGPSSANALRLLATLAVITAVSVALGASISGPDPVAAQYIEDPPQVPGPRARRAADEVADEPLPKGVTARFGSLQYRIADRIAASALSPNGKLLAIADGSMVRVFEAATWELVHRLPTDPSNGGWANGGNLAFSPDGRYLGYAKNGETAYIWNLVEGKLASRFDGERERWMGFCTFTSEGLFVLADKARLYFYDPATGREARSIPSAGKIVRVSPDGKWLVRLAKSDDPIRMILASTKQDREQHQFDALVRWTSRNHGVAFSPDGKLMTLLPATGKALELWDVATRTRVASLPSPEEGDTHGRSGPATGFAAGGKMVWLKLPNGDIARWGTATRRELPRLQAGGQGLLDLHAFPDGKTLLTPTVFGWVRLWNSETGSEIPVPGRYAYATKMSVSPDGKLVAAGDASGRIDLLNAVSGKLVRTLREKGEPVLQMVFSTDGKLLAVGEGRDLPSGGRPSQVRVVTIADGTTVRVVEPDSELDDRITAARVLGFSGDGKQLLVAQHPRDVRLLDLATGTERWRLKLRFGGTPSPDGRLLAAEDDYAVALIDIPSGKEVRRIEVAPEARKDRGVVGAYKFAWSADGKTVAVGLPGSDVVAVLDPATGRERVRFVGRVKPPAPEIDKLAPNATVRGLAISPNGKWAVVTALHGRQTAVWDAVTGKLIVELPHEFQVEEAVFTPDGKVITFGSGGIGYRWDLDTIIAAPKK